MRANANTKPTAATVVRLAACPIACDVRVLVADRTQEFAPRPSRRASVVAGLALLGLFGIFLARSWQAWGHLVSDHGREMFVPLRLTEGDLLYEDVRYPYGPLSPYLHALFYGLWKPHLAVLYASGIASTAVCLFALYEIGRQIGSLTAAVLAAALAMIDLMFRPAVPHFSFLFPYAYPATHGLAFLLVSLAGALRLVRNPSVGMAIVVGVFVGLALLTKQEFGAIALGTGGLAAFAMVATKGFAHVRTSVAALAGSALGVAAVGWGAMATVVSPSTILWRGLFAEEYFGWPLTWHIAGLPVGMSAFEALRHLGSLYLRSAPLLLVVIGVVVGVGVASAPAGTRSGDPRLSPRRVLAWSALRVAALSLAVVCGWQFADAVWGLATSAREGLRLRYSYLPLLLLGWALIDTLGVVRDWHRTGRPREQRVARWMVVVVATVMLFRVPGKAVPGSYANFYLGPGLLLATILLVDLLPRSLTRFGCRSSAARVAGVIAVAALVGALAVPSWARWGTRTVPLTTARGTMMLPDGDPIVPMYREALDVIAARTRPGDEILAVPTETSLYFLSGRSNHLFEPGLMTVLTTPESERSYIAELEAQPPKLVLTSSRALFEYGRGMFGHDYGREVYRWLRGRYAPLGDLLGEPPLVIAPWEPHEGPDTPDPRGTIAASRDVVYSRVGDRDLRLDIFRPTGFASPRPALVFFHGGGWMRGDKSDAFPDAGTFWARQGVREWPTLQPYLDLGMAVVAVEYRLSSEAAAPAAVVDALASIEWLAAHGKTYGVDPRRLVVVGVSAGGHLALMAALTYETEAFAEPTGLPRPRARIVAAIDLYGPTDLEDLVSGPNERVWAMSWLGEGEGDGRDGLARRVSPLSHVHEGAPPVHIIHSDADRVVPYDHAVRLRDALEEVGADVELVTLPGGVHGFLDEAEQGRVKEVVVRFLRELDLVDRASRAN